MEGRKQREYGREAINRELTLGAQSTTSSFKAVGQSRAAYGAGLIVCS